MQRLLGLSACALFLGHAWLYLTHRSKLSVFFWNQDWLEKPLASWFDIDWEQYAATSEPLIHRTDTVFAFALFLGALLSLHAGWRKPRLPWRDSLLLLASLFLIPFWLLAWTDRNLQLPMFLEHFLQWGTPFLLLAYPRLKPKTWYLLTAIFIAATFAGHGLYALGWPHDRPANFTTMVIALTPLGEPGSAAFLIAAGILDLLLIPALFLSSQRLRIIALAYATLWGLATAFARILSHFTPAEKFYGLDPWLAETILRLPHGLVPLALLLTLLPKRSQSI